MVRHRAIGFPGLAHSEHTDSGHSSSGSDNHRGGADSNSASNTDLCTYGYPATNGDSYVSAYGNAYPDAHPSANLSTNSNAGSDRNRDAKSAAHCDIYCDGDLDCNRYTDANSYGYGASDRDPAADSHSHAYIIANAIAHRNCAANVYPAAVSHSNSKFYPHRAADANGPAVGKRHKRTRRRG